MTIRGNIKLKAAQKVIDGIERLKIGSTTNLARLSELQSEIERIQDQSDTGIFLSLTQERDLRAQQDHHDKLEIALFDISWNHLTGEEKQILHTFHRQRLTREEAVAILCEELERSESTIWNRYRRALNHFSEVLRVS